MKSKRIHKAAVMAALTIGSIIVVPAAQASAIEHEHQVTNLLIQQVEQEISECTPVQSIEEQVVKFDEYSPIQRIE